MAPRPRARAPPAPPHAQAHLLAWLLVYTITWQPHCVYATAAPAPVPLSIASTTQAGPPASTALSAHAADGGLPAEGLIVMETCDCDSEAGQRRPVTRPPAQHEPPLRCFAALNCHACQSAKSRATTATRPPASCQTRTAAPLPRRLPLHNRHTLRCVRASLALRAPLPTTTRPTSQLQHRPVRTCRGRRYAWPHACIDEGMRRQECERRVPAAATCLTHLPGPAGQPPCHRQPLATSQPVAPPAHAPHHRFLRYPQPACLRNSKPKHRCSATSHDVVLFSGLHYVAPSHRILRSWSLPVERSSAHRATLLSLSAWPVALPGALG